jgi:pyruvate kinase
MMRHTQIVATLGPATAEISIMEDLLRAGLNVARINASHGTPDQWMDLASNLRKACKNTKLKASIMMDLQGPKIRLGNLKAPITVKKGQVLKLNLRRKIQTDESVPLPYLPLLKSAKIGDDLLIEDGLIQTKIIKIQDPFIEIAIKNDGLLQSHKGVNLPNVTLPASASLSKKDRSDLEFAIKSIKVDAIALSFVETAKDLKRVRQLLTKRNATHIKLIAKIERKKALLNLEEIIRASDGIMVARGDLGIETPLERVPIEQKFMLTLAHHLEKPVIVATQILDSMVDNPIPTRAEISDAAQAVFDHADAFMLSNETAVGKYPVEAVKTLAKVADATESALWE